MKSYKNNKHKDIVPRIFWGLTVTSGVIVFCLGFVSLFFIFIPEANWIKAIIAISFDIVIYAVASFIDVSNNGIDNILKRFFSRNIEAVKIKSIKKFKVL